MQTKKSSDLNKYVSKFRVFGSKISFSKVVGGDLMELCGEKGEPGKGLGYALGRAWSAKQVDQNDAFLGHLKATKAHVRHIFLNVKCKMDNKMSCL